MWPDGKVSNQARIPGAKRRRKLSVMQNERTKEFKRKDVTVIKSDRLIENLICRGIINQISMILSISIVENIRFIDMIKRSKEKR